VSRLRPLEFREVLRLLSDAGFRPVSQRGSHLKLRHRDGRIIIVPIHSGRPIKVGLLHRILRDAGIDLRRLR